MNITVRDFTKICRLCLSQCDLQPLTSSAVVSVFEHICCIKICIEDKMPEGICSACIGYLDSVNEFIERCKENDALFKKLITQDASIEQTHAYEDEDSFSSLSDDVDEFLKAETTFKVESRERPSQPRNVNTSRTLSIHNCKKCGTVFNKKSLLSSHYREFIKCRPKNYKLLKCEICHKEFTTAQRKKDHMNLHTGATPYTCVYCDKPFKGYSAHFKHIYRHRVALGEIEKRDAYTEKRVKLKLSCELCPDKVFASRSGYANHLLTKHGDGDNEVLLKRNRFLCNFCAKCFSTRHSLEGHLRVHTGERPFQCTICGKQFKHQGALKVHQLSHLDARPRPFKCDVCQKTFTQKDHCDVHKRTHTGEKPYQCNFCGKSFNYGTYYRIHLRMHTGDTPYSCSICGAKYHDKSSLTKHQKRKGHIKTATKNVECNVSK